MAELNVSLFKGWVFHIEVGKFDEFSAWFNITFKSNRYLHRVSELFIEILTFHFSIGFYNSKEKKL